MQREALILSTALLTVAVLAAGHGPEQAADMNPEPIQQIDEPVSDQSVALERETLEGHFGPVHYQVVGIEGEKSATLTVNLDVSI
ncbi:MAG: hypothetical protein AB8G17_11670 [Gammaproteobacteria bacterium]